MISWSAQPEMGCVAEAAPEAAFAVCGTTHRGLVRAHNEDAWLADAGLGLALVADGLGGHADGGLASRDVVASMERSLRRALTALKREARTTDAYPLAAQERAVASAIALAHKNLISANAGTKDSRFRRGSTVAGLWIPPLKGAPATIFHVGDSRLYLHRDHGMKQLTRDHSAYERWAGSGKLGTAPPKNQILQALGVSESVQPDITSFQPNEGDRILICTDGLTGGVQDSQLQGALDGASPNAVCEELVAMGLAGGGKDNLTIVLCTFLQPDGPQ